MGFMRLRSHSAVTENLLTERQSAVNIPARSAVRPCPAPRKRPSLPPRRTLVATAGGSARFLRASPCTGPSTPSGRRHEPWPPNRNPQPTVAALNANFRCMNTYFGVLRKYEVVLATVSSKVYVY